MADVRDESFRPPGPVVWKRWLGAELARLRSAAKLRQSDAAGALGCSVGRISYLEKGERSPSVRELEDVLLPLYRVPEQDRQAYLAAAAVAEQHAWWDDWGEDIVSSQLRRYIGLEAGAQHLRVYHPSAIPGLLQTPDYTKALLESLVTQAPVRIARAIELRQTRQSVLSREVDPLNARFILDESALRRMIGGADTLRAQLNHIADVIEQRPNLELGVVPFSVGAHGAFMGQFTIMDFGGIGDFLVFIEGFDEFMFLESRNAVNRYSSAYDRLTALSLGSDESIATVRSLATGGLD